MLISMVSRCLVIFFAQTLFLSCSSGVGEGKQAAEQGGEGTDDDSIDEKETQSEQVTSSAGEKENEEDHSPGESSVDEENDKMESGSGIEPKDPDSDDEVVFDVLEGEGEEECKFLEPGIHCQNDGLTVYECDEKGNKTVIENCYPKVCSDGVGCTLCREEQFSCRGDKIYKCDTSVPGHQWRVHQECAFPQICDERNGKCLGMDSSGDVVRGSAEVTGKYHLYSTFEVSKEYPLLADVYNIDSFEKKVEVEGELIDYENRLYVSKYRNRRLGYIDVYEVLLFDSDGDGKLEPEQHPDDSRNPGPIEERELVFLKTLTPEELGLAKGDNDRGRSEIYALEDRLFVLAPAGIVEYLFETGETRVIAPRPPQTETLGYDEINQLWFAGTRSRRVVTFDAEIGAWGGGFFYPDLVGDHMDGLEVVVSPSDGKPYVYVSDMTSDFISQYTYHPLYGWQQENVFAYTGPPGSLVEGMGHGAFGHFWITGGFEIYEVGGGDIAKYVEPIE